MKRILVFIFLFGTLLFAISHEEFKWLLDREFFDILEKHETKVDELLKGNPEDIELALEYAQRGGDWELELRCHELLALNHHNLKAALEWLRLADFFYLDSFSFEETRLKLQDEFTAPDERALLDHVLYGTPEAELLEVIRHLDSFNPAIEDLARQKIDEISVESSDSLALAMIADFERNFPVSDWGQAAYYYKLYHHSSTGNYAEMDKAIEAQAFDSCVHLYISALYLLSPGYRRQCSDNALILNQTIYMLDKALRDYQDNGSARVVYDLFDPVEWKTRLRFTRVKASYYYLLSTLGFWGDEEELCALLPEPDDNFVQLLNELNELEFANNDRGEQAELLYWKGRLLSLCSNQHYLLEAAESYVQSLILGSPRRKFENPCLQSLETLRQKLDVNLEIMDWARALMNYEGIIFEEHPFDIAYSRIAIGDFDNDGWSDLLFNGSALYRNLEGQSFENISEEANLSRLKSSGGLWADFNRDGLLDFVSISHHSDDVGDALMKNQGDGRFVKVNERAGDIDDGFPSEAATWIDLQGSGYPSLYVANYEKWQSRAGFEDYFWKNEEGYFSDASAELGFWDPPYATQPGLAGRGVAPADFNNDGIQEILVTNYRLNRNFCWELTDGKYRDIAAQNGLAGHFKDGYFGHSIGADWADIDNDGDLDLFIANLAHPRYIEFSDVSMLLRNDGPGFRVVAGDTLRFWQFTDITREAGITYDELHSDPLWFDADNDGLPDLFISSVYENDRSYLYHNNGDGTFTDITFLSGARVFNGWGNATADLDRDGLLDLVVCGGNGSKILLNRTPTENQSLFVKPVWSEEGVILITDPSEYPNHPNSPAFGTRVKVNLLSPAGREYSLIRELSSSKGTCSQNSQELHFGLGASKVLNIEIIEYEKD
jgi:hypothetical protein